MCNVITVWVEWDIDSPEEEASLYGFEIIEFHEDSIQAIYEYADALKYGYLSSMPGDTVYTDQRRHQDLSDYIAEMLTEKTGFLVSNFKILEPENEETETEQERELRAIGNKHVYIPYWRNS